MEIDPLFPSALPVPGTWPQVLVISHLPFAVFHSPYVFSCCSSVHHLLLPFWVVPVPWTSHVVSVLCASAQNGLPVFLLVSSYASFNTRLRSLLSEVFPDSSLTELVMLSSEASVYPLKAELTQCLCLLAWIPIRYWELLENRNHVLIIFYLQVPSTVPET